MHFIAIATLFCLLGMTMAFPAEPKLDNLHSDDLPIKSAAAAPEGDLDTASTFGITLGFPYGVYGGYGMGYGFGMGYGYGYPYYNRYWGGYPYYGGYGLYGK